MELLTQPNTVKTPILQWHILPLPQCCPVSGNPQPGSQVVFLYHAGGKFLEVYSLRKLLESYIGGRDPIRDMEGMVQTLAAECAQTLGAPVTVGAFVRLQRGDAMVTIAQGAA